MGVESEPFCAVSLPHDGAICEARSPDSDGGVNTGWFEAFDYEYVKTFEIPDAYKNKLVIFEFEGVYRDAEVFVNGVRVAERHYGYTNFYVDASEFLAFGGSNELRVTARNADQPNSRWYSGAGIYRPVTMWIADKRHILMNGVKIRTTSLTPPTIQVTVATSEIGEVEIAINRNGASVVTAVGRTDDKREAVFELCVQDAELWSPDHPELYECVVKFCADECRQTFGIRTIGVTPRDGFLLNGERLVLRGACIHSDNGILGARSYPEAEARKVTLLKRYGYNAIRSAHNPAAKSLLDECDRQGMLVLDEYCDVWYIHKNKYDYASRLETEYVQDISDMVNKDYNHPSVVMYSLGNEVAETGEKRGIELFGKMRDVCVALDPDRPVTVGVNIFFNYLYALGFGQYSDKKAQKSPKKKVGSEFFNHLAGLFGAGFMKTMAMLPGCDRKTRDCFAIMDVAGYNYGIKRYERDIRRYPERVILGSETFCADAYKFWEFAKTHPALIGDFVWAGMDYLGEVGVGSWEYREYAPSFAHGVGWLTAGSGRIDLIGNPLGEALYTRVVFELEDKPQIAVVPVGHTNESHSPSAWKFSNAIPSWSWNGLDGKPARVEVYSRAPIIELFINGKSVGKKRRKRDCRLVFNVRYRGGELTAIARDERNNELNRNSLVTAGDKTVLAVAPEKPRAAKGEVCFARLRYVDETGLVKPLERGVISVNVEGGELLAVGSACPFNTMGYMTGKTDTYYGEALAVIKATGDVVRIEASDGKLVGTAQIVVE